MTQWPTPATALSGGVTPTPPGALPGTLDNCARTVTENVWSVQSHLVKTPAQANVRTSGVSAYVANLTMLFLIIKLN